MNMRVTFSIFFGLLVVCRSTVGAAQSLEHIERGYLQNRELFKHFHCTFRVKEGLSPNVEAAIAGRIADPITKSGAWIVSDRGVRYELICDAPPEKSKPPRPIRPGGPAFTLVKCSSRVILFANETGSSLSYIDRGHVVNLKGQGTVDIVTTPISMGVMAQSERRSPAGDIQLARSMEKATGRYLGKRKFDGNDLVGFEIVTKVGNEIDKRQWWLDPQRGFLPIRVIFYDATGDNVQGTTFATKIKKCSNGGFICQRSVQTWARGDQVKAVIVELLHLDLKKPPPEKLALRLPKGTKVLDEKDGRSRFRLENDETVTVDNMQSLFDRAEKRLQERLRR